MVRHLIWFSNLPLLRCFQDHCYRSVIGQGDLHGGTKAAGGRDDTHLGHFPDKMVIKRFGMFRWRGRPKRGSAPLAAVGVEGELADEQDSATGLLHRAVHDAVFVVEEVWPAAGFVDTKIRS